MLVNIPQKAKNVVSKLQKLKRRLMPPHCQVCGGETLKVKAYKREFFKCESCEFIFTDDYNVALINRGMGMEGSWTGPGGGGYREYFLVKMLYEDLGKRSFLLFGTGNTKTFENLQQEKIDVNGCDISKDVVSYKKQLYGEESFYLPEEIPEPKKYDVIVAVEVFEHFVQPKTSLNLLIKHLEKGGIICGTTNFYDGCSIEDNNNPGYMSIKSHVAYWNHKSLSKGVEKYGLVVSEFEMIRPGSVMPDEKYGQLYPNKRVFFIYEPHTYGDYFQNLSERSPILPIDKP